MNNLIKLIIIFLVSFNLSANEKSSETKKIEIRSNVGPLTNLFKFFDEWIRYSYEAWVKAGKPEIL